MCDFVEFVGPEYLSPFYMIPLYGFISSKVAEIDCTFHWYLSFGCYNSAAVMVFDFEIISHQWIESINQDFVFVSDNGYWLVSVDAFR